MRSLSAKYPDDADAAAFSALAILGTAHEGRDVPTYMRDFAVYMKGAALVEEVFAKNPLHPGAVHYLIHSYDDPAHAVLGLRAARSYSKIAPDAAHAQHMTSHIFVALGMWDEAAAINERSVKAADARRAAGDAGARLHRRVTWGPLRAGKRRVRPRSHSRSRAPRV